MPASFYHEGTEVVERRKRVKRATALADAVPYPLEKTKKFLRRPV
jgi:hypothetical protein